MHGETMPLTAFFKCRSVSGPCKSRRCKESSGFSLTASSLSMVLPSQGNNHTHQPPLQLALRVETKELPSLESRE